MTIIEINSSHIFVQCSDLKGALLGGTFVASKNVWRLPHNLGALRDLKAQGYNVDDHLKKMEMLFDKMVDSKTADQDTTYPRLRDYQNADVNFLLRKPQFGIFSEQRTGKTPTTCTMLGQRAVKTIVVVPTSLVYDWKAQIENWADMEAIAVKGTPAQRKKQYKRFHETTDKPVALVISRGTVSRDIDLLQSLNYEAVVIDEAHFLRNYGTAQSEAMYKLGKYATYRYALTGTPASNKPDDVFGILKFLYPARFTSYWQFAERYFTVSDGHFGKKVSEKFKTVSRKKEYYEMMEQYSIQRKRSEVMVWLQGTQKQVVELEMGTTQRKAYESMAKTFISAKSDGTELDAPTVLAQMTRLRQLSLAPSSVGVDGGSVKQDYVMEWLENNGNEPVLIFSNFTSYLVELYEVMKKKKHKVALITGQQTPEERQDAKDKFQAGKLRVLLCNIEAAGVGLTLDRAETAIFLDRHYNPTWNLQAQDRLVATTPESPQGAFVIDLVCKDSIDEYIHEMVEKKIDITSIVNNFSDLRKIALGGK